MEPWEAVREIRAGRCDCGECFYCDVGLGYQHDHFPVPRSAGGAVVPACLDCHDLKDRYLLNSWPPAASFEALRGLHTEVVESASTTERRDLAAWLAAQPSLRDREILERWSSLPSLSRVYYAKVRALFENDLRCGRIVRFFAEPAALAEFMRAAQENDGGQRQIQPRRTAAAPAAKRVLTPRAA